MKIYNILDKKQYVEDYFRLCNEEWGIEENAKLIKEKAKRFLSQKNDNIISILVLVNKDSLVGFISLFKEDGPLRKELTPWYATMYVKKEYRGNGYSRILSDAIKKEAHSMGYRRIYLKSELINYYEKFGAIYMDNLSETEKLFYMDV